METEYIRKLNQSNLIITMEKECYDLDSVQMFHYNQIPSFLTFQELKKNGRQQFCYDITGKLSIDQSFICKGIDIDKLHRLLTAIDQACVYAADYMLSEDCILLQPDYIFTDSEEKIYFCYLPDLERELRSQLEQFLEYLLQRIEHKDQMAVQLAYGIYECIVQGTCGLHDALQDYQKEKRLFSQDLFEEKKKQPSIQEEEAFPEPMPKKQENDKGLRKEPEARESAVARLKKRLFKKIFTDQYAEEETEITYEYEEEEEYIPHPTVCLTQNGQAMQYQFIYQGMDRDRDFQVAGRQVIIGSNKKEVDVCIPLPIISRIHARLEKDESGVYVEDLNSTNGTAVNGEQLPYKQKQLLQKGDIVSFAGENYSIY